MSFFEKRRQLDRNITHLRAARHLQMQQGLSAGSEAAEGGRVSSPGRSVYSSTHEYAGGLDSGGSTGLLVPENSISILNACIARVFKTDTHSLWVKGAEPVENLLSGLVLLKEGSGDPALDALVAASMEEIRQSSQSLADACVVTPKQFWKVADLFCACLLQCPRRNSSFTTAIEAFCSLGLSINARDPRGSFLLFCDFALPKLQDALQSQPYKRVGVLQVLVSFVSTDSSSRIQCIRRLQLNAPDTATFIFCLAVLASKEVLMTTALVDSYCYYVRKSFSTIIL